ncbi:unnamed protein product [Caenorhabditis angaria]|uniref:C2H2-type domain-containing protein n=1 Tax=Caenorhabditis angaria TaxID=860376 RepID=A0A9P1NBW6_9PELO|nr:unnamed protein product [Caenorhabditis angaria]
MDDYMNNYNYYQPPPGPPGSEMYGQPQQPPIGALGLEDGMGGMPKPNDPPPPPPVVICPTEVDHINVTLEKNQQCECKDCGKLFNSVWYLKQHAVKHSNDRPFKCKFCFKTYKFRSNLYQHKCPERQKSLQQRRRGGGGGSLISPNPKKLEMNQMIKTKVEPIPIMHNTEEPQIPMCPPPHCYSETEDNDAPITYGLVIQNLDQNQLQQQQQQQMQMQQQQHMQPVQNNNFPMTMDPLMNDAENAFDKDFDCVRGQQLPTQQIEAFVQKNKQKLFSCRKCRVLLPTEESYLRHSASHSGDDLFPYKCTNCRQAFENDKELQKHAQHHSLEEGPWRCDECCGQFRSSVALKRHKDQCRPCFIPPVQNNIMVSVHSPFDPFSFIPAENEHLFLPVCDELARGGTDSGVGSEGSPNSMSQASPDRSGMSMEDAFNIINDKKKDKEDDEDSGFRSRLNSVTQSCSPDSFASHNGESPPRKLSGNASHDPSVSFLGGYGTGPAYGQQLFFEQPAGTVGGEHRFDMLAEEPIFLQMSKASLISLPSTAFSTVDIQLAPVIIQSITRSMKEMSIDSEVSSRFDSDFDACFSDDNNVWKNDGYDKPASELEITNEHQKLFALILMLIAVYVNTVIEKYISVFSILSQL